MNILCINAETTGMNVPHDDLIQLRMELLANDAVHTPLQSIDLIDELIIPEHDFTISDGAFAVHHINKEMVLSKGVHIKDLISRIQTMFSQAGYIMMWHGSNFIFPTLLNALHAAGLDIDIKKYYFIDPGEIELALNSNQLAAVYERYTGRALPVTPTLEQRAKAMQAVYNAQIERYGDGIEPIVNEITTNMLVSPDRFLYINKNGDICFSRGQHANETVQDVLIADPSYISWVMKSEVLTETKRTIAYIYNKVKNS